MIEKDFGYFRYNLASRFIRFLLFFKKPTYYGIDTDYADGELYRICIKELWGFYYIIECTKMDNNQSQDKGEE